MLLIFLFGLFIGSFLNVCIYRIPIGKSIAFPSSHCFKCGNRLRAIDLVPVLSFIIYRGKCRYCGEKISWQYPLIEIFNGLIYVFLYFRFGLNLSLAFYMFLSSLLLVISVIDYYHQIIPDGLSLLVFFLSIAYRFMFYEAWLIDSILGFLVGGGILFAVAVLSNGGMGGGDIKLMAALGIWLGWRLTLMALLISVVLGALISICLLAFKIKSRKDAIPFGPFLVIGSFLVIVYGEAIFNYYINFVLF